MALVNKKISDQTKGVKDKRPRPIKDAEPMPKEEWIQMMLKKYPSRTRKSLEYSLVKWS